MTKDKTPIYLSPEFVGDVRQIIESGRKQAYEATSSISLATYWKIGRRIVEEEQHGKARAEYGTRLIGRLAEQLRKDYGPSYNKRNLEHFRNFYLLFNNLEIVNEFVHNLSWTHIRSLLSVTNPSARNWYLAKASRDGWSTTTLDRNINTQYFERRLAEHKINPDTQLPEALAPYNEKDPLEYIKNPMIAEFMGFRQNINISESDLEQALIDNLQQFILELGRGFAFVDRQQHISTDTDDFYIDLVFYNFRMKRFVIFELKTHKMRHADIGQLDMYVRMYDDLFKGEDDNPTIGVLLCTDTDSTIAKYSVLNDSNNLFAAKYMAYMPTEEELRQEIERQKRFFLEHHRPGKNVASH